MKKEDIKIEMNRIICKNIEERERWVEDSKKSVRYLEVIDMLPDVFFADFCHWDSVSEYGLVFKMPYNRNLMRDVELLMENLGFSVGWKRKEEDINNSYDVPTTVFEIKEQKISISVYFSDHLPESTCTRKEIGHTTKEVPVYEWSCDGVEIKVKMSEKVC